MKKENNKKTFILEFEVVKNKKYFDICEKKLRIGRSMYNAFLNEAMKRLRKYRHDPRYIKARDEYRLAKENKEKDLMKQYGDVMNQVKREYGYGGKFCLADMRKKQSNHFKGALGAQVSTTLSQRAYRAVENFDRNTEVERINFVRAHEDFSIEGCTNDNGIIYRDGKIYFDIRKDVYVEIKPTRKNDDWYYNEALQNEVKYCRLLSRTIRGKKRYYVQLCMAGTPPNKRTYGSKDVEILDVKISHAEYRVKGRKPINIELAPGCKNPEDKIAEVDRKMDASKRATNPNNYNEDGTTKKGPLKWNYSNNYKKLRARRAELYRSMSARRKISHEELTNKILAEGSDITIKHLSYKDQQKRSTAETKINPATGMPHSKARQGKNIGNRAPSEFISILDRKLSYIDKKLINES